MLPAPAALPRVLTYYPNTWFYPAAPRSASSPLWSHPPPTVCGHTRALVLGAGVSAPLLLPRAPHGGALHTTPSPGRCQLVRRDRLDRPTVRGPQVFLGLNDHLMSLLGQSSVTLSHTCSFIGIYVAMRLSLGKRTRNVSSPLTS